MTRFTNLLLIVGLIFVFSGCGNKEVEVYNKPALYWYQHMITDIANANIDRADNDYSSLEGEHIGSPLLATATLILAIAHFNNKDYLLSTHFLNEYINRYANPNEKLFCEYLKIKEAYLALPRPRRNQASLNKTIKLAKLFKLRYPNSQYFPIVDTMLTRMLISRAIFNKDISLLYKRINKPLSAKFYISLIPQKWIDWNKVIPSDIPWYREWFVGNGKSSWYGFMLPHTINVVARHSVQIKK